MHHKIIDFTLTSIAGVWGYGIMQVNLHLSDETIKFILSMATAVLAGFLGYMGKVLAAWLLRKAKSIRQLKIKK